MSLLLCPNGHDNPASGAAFCSTCGQPLPPEAGNEQNVETWSTTTTAPPPASRALVAGLNKKLVGIVGALVLLVVGAVAWIALGSNGKEGLSLAAEACNGVLTLAEGDEGFEEVSDRGQVNADKAARAAAADSKWDGLASATSDFATTQKEFLAHAEDGLGSDDLSGLEYSITVLTRITEDLTADKKEILAECRKVQAEGGEVDQGLMDDFIR